MLAATERIDDIFSSSPDTAVVVAVSLPDRAVLVQRTRADVASSAVPPQSPTAVASPVDDHAGSASAASLPSQALVEQYVALCAHCAEPFTDAYDPKPASEWTLAKFQLRNWNVVAFRDATPAGGPAASPMPSPSDGTPVIDGLPAAHEFMMVVFSDAGAA